MNNYFNWLRKECTKEEEKKGQKRQKCTQSLFNNCPGQTLSEHWT